MFPVSTMGWKQLCNPAKDEVKTQNLENTKYTTRIHWVICLWWWHQPQDYSLDAYMTLHAPFACWWCLSWRLIPLLHCICACSVRVSKRPNVNSTKQYNTKFYAMANPEYLSFNEPDIFEKDCKAPPTMLSVKSETPPRVEFESMTIKPRKTTKICLEIIKLYCYKWMASHHQASMCISQRSIRRNFRASLWVVSTYIITFLLYSSTSLTWHDQCQFVSL